MRYNKKIFAIIILLGILFFANKVYNLSLNMNDKDFQDKVLAVVENQDYIDLKSIVTGDWDTMYILNLNEDLNLYSEKYNIDFSNINLPYRDRSFYQLIVFLKDGNVIKYGYLGTFIVYFQINSEKDRIVFNDDSKFRINKEIMYKYILHK